MGTAAYPAVVKVSGTSTTFSAEAFTSLGGNVYQMTNTAKQVFDRNQSLGSGTGLYFKGNGTNIAPASVASVDMLKGTVTFTGAQSTPITGYGKYIPMSVVAGAKAYSVNGQTGLMDDTSFDVAGANGGYKTRKYGLLTASATISRWDDLVGTFAAILAARNAIVLEFRPGGGAQIMRGWFVPESVNNSGEVGALVEEALSFQLDGDGTSVLRSGLSWS